MSPPGEGPESGGDRGGEPPRNPQNDEDSRLWEEIAVSVHGLETTESRRHLSKQFAQALEGVRASDLLAEYSAATCEDLLQRLRTVGSAAERVEIRDLCWCWLFIFRLITLRNPHRLDELLIELEHRFGSNYALREWLHYSRHWGWHAMGNDRSIGGRILSGLLFRMPLPKQWRRHPDAVSIGHLLSIVGADRNYLLKLISNPAEFTPVLAASLLVTSGGSIQNHQFQFSWDYDGGSDAQQAIYERAGSWLGALLPGRELDSHVAGEIIGELRRPFEP